MSVTIPPDILETIRKSAQAIPGAKAPAWRSQGFNLADAQLRASTPGAGPAEKRAYLYALAVFAGLAVGEIERLTKRNATGEEQHRASA